MKRMNILKAIFQGLFNIITFGPKPETNKKKPTKKKTAAKKTTAKKTTKKAPTKKTATPAKKKTTKKTEKVIKEVKRQPVKGNPKKDNSQEHTVEVALKAVDVFKSVEDEVGKKRYIGRLANNLKKAQEAKDSEAIETAITKITNYIEKNKG